MSKLSLFLNRSGLFQCFVSQKSYTHLLIDCYIESRRMHVTPQGCCGPDALKVPEINDVQLELLNNQEEWNNLIDYLEEKKEKIDLKIKNYLKNVDDDKHTNDDVWHAKDLKEQRSKIIEISDVLAEIIKESKLNKDKDITELRAILKNK